MVEKREHRNFFTRGPLGRTVAFVCVAIIGSVISLALKNVFLPGISADPNPTSSSTATNSQISTTESTIDDESGDSTATADTEGQNNEDAASAQTGTASIPMSVDVGVSIPGAEGVTKFNYQTYVKALFNFAVNILGPILAVMMIMYGGYLYMFSAGDDTKVKEGTSIIIGSSIGYAILFIAKFLLNLLVGPGGGSNGL